MSLVAELQRRNVIRVGAAYVALAWLIVQILDSLGSVFGLSDAVSRIIVILLAIGLVPTLVVSWLFELTPEGFAREGTVDHDAETSRAATRRLDRIIIAILAVAVAYFAVDKFVLDPARDAELVSEAAERARDAALTDGFGAQSIAVLPFADLSPDGDQEYFSDGIAEEIINLLSGIRDLRVIARSSSFAFKGQNLTARDIGERLDVGFVMEGSVRRQGERLRITATMIDARTNSQIWSERFDRDFGDVFAIQDAIASEVVQRLELQISGDIPLAARVDPRSYALVLQARHLLTRHRGDAAAEADRLLGEALDLDPNNVAALLLYRTVDRQRLYWGLLAGDQFADTLRARMERVLELDPGNAEARFELALLDADALGTPAAGLAAAAEGMRLMPTHVEANQVAAHRLARAGHADRAAEYYDYALSKDPLCASCLRGLMLTLMGAGRYERALEVNGRYRTLTGGSGTYMRGVIQLLQGDPETALATFESAQTIPWVVTQGKALAYWSLGRTENFEAALEDVRAAIDDERYANLSARPEDFLASAYAWAGRPDDAFRILEARIDPPRSRGPDRWNTDPLLRSLHDDPRWSALLAKAEYSPEHLSGLDIDKLFPGPGKSPATDSPLMTAVMGTATIHAAAGRATP